LQHHYKIDPNEVRSLPVGEAFVIARGKAMRIRINQAPQLRTALPDPVVDASAQPTQSEAQTWVVARELGY
jgi:hypothetical protein